jgi:hypothetical protein
MDKPLHPNLARIAAAYDDVMSVYRSGQITPAEARRRVLTLVARDDTGLEWSINPDSGLWQYRNQFGEMITGNPPAYGVVNFTPADLGGGPERAERVTMYEVDQELLRGERTLRGSTMLTGKPARGKRSVKILLALVALVSLVLLLPQLI